MLCEENIPLLGSLVSSIKPDGLILSTGNLYFTSHNDTSATVWRMAQSAVPGQEILLYTETEQGARFGDIVFAEVGGAFYGYFLAQLGGTITIKRIPLTPGGAATVVATTDGDIDIANSHRTLVTDGVNLYWQDGSSVLKVPIGGGANPTALDQCSDNTPTAGMALQGANLIYASSKDIRYVPTAGTTIPPSSRTIVTADGRVQALHAVLDSVYWADDTGIKVVRSGSAPVTLPSIPGFTTAFSTSVHGSSVYAQAWTQTPAGENFSRLHIDVANGESSDYGIDADAFFVSLAESGTVFWGDSTGVHRYIPRLDVVVPDVQLDTADGAGRILELHHLVPRYTGPGGVVASPVNSFVKSQSPKPGTVVPPGTVVSILVLPDKAPL
jgi:hypothetical protein